MTELAHQFGADLSLSATGDLALASGSQATQQRVLRRLLTVQGDYLWQLDYGAGFPAMIGQPALPARIKAIARAQMAKEQGVAVTPRPVVTVTGDQNGGVFAQISFADAQTGDTATLSAPVG